MSTNIEPSLKESEPPSKKLKLSNEAHGEEARDGLQHIKTEIKSSQVGNNDKDLNSDDDTNREKGSEGSEHTKTDINNAVVQAQASLATKINQYSGASAPSALTVPQATELPPENGRPPRGSAEWQKLRKMNHKEVERRRRESINAAIRELQELLPAQSTNKSQIIKRAAEYIRRLKANENANIEKWTLEKLITDQAVNELANSNEKLKSELEKAYREIECLKKETNQKDGEINQLKASNNKQ